LSGSFFFHGVAAIDRDKPSRTRQGAAGRLLLHGFNTLPLPVLPEVALAMIVQVSRLALHGLCLRADSWEVPFFLQ
jgi:hypothetical protein